MEGICIVVGCGQAKQDTTDPVRAEDLYTSTYFDLKKRYAQAKSTPEDGNFGWAILSAKHATLWPHLEKEPYDTTIDDLREEDSPVASDAYQDINYPWTEPEYHTRLDFWARRVHFGLASWLDFKSGFPDETPHCQRLKVLAGDDYIEPLLERDVFEPFPWDTTFPFQEHDFSGIGEQMSWLKDETETYEENPVGQAEFDDFDVEDYTEQSDLHDYI